MDFRGPQTRLRSYLRHPKCLANVRGIVHISMFNVYEVITSKYTKMGMNYVSQYAEWKLLRLIEKH